MIRILENDEYVNVKKIYDEHILYFPIITSVVNQFQGGYILNKNELYLIVHKFGFSYILNSGRNTSKKDYFNFFEEAKIKLKDKVKVIRLYDPLSSLREINIVANISNRIKLFYEDDISYEQTNSYKFLKDTKFDDKDLFGLQLCSRFWNNCLSFLKNSYACLYIKNSEVEGICYSAAVSEQFAEIDIYVNTLSRGQNIGLNLVRMYIYNLKLENLVPLWDCYANNLASYNLAKRIGFKVKFEYDFYNIKVSE